MKKVKPHKIQVLLVDDDPAGLPKHHEWPHKHSGPPGMHADYEEWFDFRWLATPQECREYRDLSWILAERSPDSLCSMGWLPEILVLDYALTQKTGTVAERVAGDSAWVKRLSPLPMLREAIGEHALKCEPHNKSFSQSVPAGNEFWGCFIGGLLLATFADHPCAPVTVTRYTEQSLLDTSIDAVFFQWLMEAQSSSLLKAQGREASPPWRKIVPAGVLHLRQRMEALAMASIVVISLEDLLALTDDPRQEVLTVSSRYGRRHYPVKGLFIDATESPSEWASRILRDAWGIPREAFNGSMADLNRGRELAETLWSAYISKDGKKNSLFEERLRLSELYARDSKKGIDTRPLSPEEKAELESCKKQFHVRNGRCQNMEKIRQIDCDAYSSAQQRWAALMIMVRLAHARYHTEKVLRAEQIRQRQNVNNLLAPPITLADVYMALFPVPSNPNPLPWHTKKRDFSGYWKKVPIDIAAILQGYGGVDNRERFILRMYAESVGAEYGNWGKSEWLSDNLSRSLLLGSESNNPASAVRADEGAMDVGQ